MKLSEIAEGFRNHLFPPKELKGVINKVSEERLNICRDCPHYKNSHCGKCGCSFPAKTKCLSCECPINKWGAMTTSEERIRIENMIKNEEE